MMDIDSAGKLLVALGIGIAILGGVFIVFSRLPILNNFGSLPGDIRIQGENFACFAPIVSMCLLSLLATIILNVIARVLAK
jgi:Protein of unknown function (DUF2905)